MGGFAFLVMLGGFAALAWWYIINVEREAGGSIGLFALKRGSAPEAGEPAEDLALTKDDQGDEQKPAYQKLDDKSYERTD